jgi:hypothetical protein
MDGVGVGARKVGAFMLVDSAQRDDDYLGRLCADDAKIGGWTGLQTDIPPFGR